MALAARTDYQVGACGEAGAGRCRSLAAFNAGGEDTDWAEVIPTLKMRGSGRQRLRHRLGSRPGLAPRQSRDDPQVMR